MEHAVIIIPGLGEGERFPFLVRHWEKYGVEPEFHLAHWKDGGAFDEKLQRLLDRIDSLTSAGKKVSLVGCSAGASLAMNVFLERRDRLYRVVSLCCWLTTGIHRARLDRHQRRYPAFVESVRRFDRRTPELTPADKANILTVRGVLDELVPAKTAMLAGTKNVVIPVPEHSLAIFAGLSFFSRPILEFIR